jgi:predicted lipoprotein with Yx(FWY)xxD motif
MFLPAMPEGVIVRTVRLEVRDSSDTLHKDQKKQSPAKTRIANILATTDGRPLYVRAVDAPPCVEECLEAWRPFDLDIFSDGAYGWTRARSADQGTQLALHGKPIYLHLDTGDTKPSAVLNEPDFEPVEFLTPVTLTTPPQIAVAEVLTAGGQILVDATSGHTLYTYDGDGRPNVSMCFGACTVDWIPLVAGVLSKPVEDFTIIDRADSLRQWSYKGKPLYRYSGDKLPEDTNGERHGAAWRAARVISYFTPPGVRLTHDPRHGVIFTTEDGRTLYARDEQRYSVGLHNTRRGPHLRGEAMVGERLGAESCADDCLKDWRPLAAPKRAIGSAFWTTVERTNGLRQWAYLGYPIYTFSGDQAPGDTKGHDSFEITDPNSALYWRVALP